MDPQQEETEPTMAEAFREELGDLPLSLLLRRWLLHPVLIQNRVHHRQEMAALRRIEQLLRRPPPQPGEAVKLGLEFGTVTPVEGKEK
jgi:hypothetical protein